MKNYISDDPLKIQREFYIFNGLYTLSASIIWGINTMYLLGAGLTIAEVFIANAGFALGMMAFEIPTGAVADISGRRTSFLWGVFIVFASTLGYLLGYYFQLSVWYFFIMSIILGLGFTFYSGALEAWAVDRLISAGAEKESGKMFSRSGAVSAGATIVGTVSGGFLADIDLGIPYLIRAACLAILLVLSFLFMKEEHEKPKEVNWIKAIGKTTADSIQYGWRNLQVRSIVLASLLRQTVFMWAWYAWQPYLLSLTDGGGYWIAGIIAVSLSMLMLIGSLLSVRLENLLGSKQKVMALSHVLTVIGMILMGALPGFFLKLIGLALIMLPGGIYGPAKQSLLHQNIPSSQRATVISFDSMVGNSGSMIGQPILGAVTNGPGYSLAYISSGIFILPAVLFMKKKKGAKEVG